MHRLFAAFISASLVISTASTADELADSVKQDYDGHLAALWDHFHRNPELSLLEHATAKRMADELRAAGFAVTEGVGGTGVVAILENGSGPLVMMRADMDGLPVEEKSGLPNASRVQQTDPITGDTVYVMHACGHDVHITSLVGTARQMVSRKDDWRGTLMLVVQPAEERGLGARMMLEDNIWERFGVPDYALAFHVEADKEAGKINLVSAPYAGVDSVDIIVHGVGGHGAYPHTTKDPIVVAAQIVLALQTLVSREISPREPAVVTVGSFHAGTKHNIISDQAHLQLTVRNVNPEVRQYLLAGIERIAVNIGRAAGLPEDKLPEVIVTSEATPAVVNDMRLGERIRAAWIDAFGAEAIMAKTDPGMAGEDFSRFMVAPTKSAIYWSIGGTAAADIAAARAGGPAIASHHSPIFKIEPEPSVRLGVESTVVALLELMGD
ncbi:MAG: amidohydrolase [Gammaproteobacteria bacterium]|nr:amidohydrolase [Gammaproteobacteria bacterium]MDH5304180.1 amidohydrolase [Gammaproteobacteria bacterium]MDH5321577.1 amidohydrolase [Gammaproteobacteria bacterium]